jgi:hypothetical protein
MKGLEFYAVSAQIIPILMLVLVIEIGVSRPIALAARWKQLLAGNVVGFSAIAEYRALRVTYVEDAAGLDPFVVILALVLLWSTVVVIGAFLPLDRP